MSGEFSPARLDAIAAALRRALPAWSLSDATAIALLNVSENATFRLDDPLDGRALVVRVHRRGYHAAEEIRAEIAWIEALRREGVVTTPAPVRGLDGDAVQTLPHADEGPARQAVAFAFVRGSEPAVDADLPHWFERLGSLTARLHGQAERWTPPPAFRRKTWDVEAMFGPDAFWGDWRAGVGLDAAGAVVIGRAIALIRARLDRFGRAPRRFGLIHADLRLANLLVEGDRLQVIDFDDCGFCWRLYDFAAAVSFFEHEPIVDDLREAWVAGYRAVADLPAAEAAEIPVFVAMRRFLLVAWIASHPEVPIARTLGAGYTAGAVAMAERLLSDFG